MADFKRLGQEFPATSWTLLNALRYEGSAEVLADFAQRYRDAVFAYIRAILKDEEQADNLTHDFFMDRIIEGVLLHRLQQRDGPYVFRPYLKQAIRNYLTDKVFRPSKISHDPLGVSSDRPDGDVRGWDRAVYGDQNAAEREYDVAFVRGVLDRALQETERVCREKGHDRQFEIFSAKFLAPGAEDRSWEDVAQEFELEKGGKQARNWAQPVIAQFRKALRYELLMETGSEEAADEELNQLLKLS